MKKIGKIFIVTILIQLVSLIIGINMSKEQLSETYKIIFFFLSIINIYLLLALIISAFKKNNNVQTHSVLKINKTNTINKIKNNLYIVKCPFYGYYDDTNDVKYNDGKSTYSKLTIKDIENVNSSWSDTINYFDNKSLKSNIDSMNMFLSKDGYCNILIYTYAELIDSDKDILLNFITNQLSKGWSKENVYTDDKGSKFSLAFWKADDWNIEYLDVKNLYLDAIEEFRSLTCKECMEITLLEEKPLITDNKLGGIPCLPLNVEIPKDSNGNDMQLLLQLNLKDVNISKYPNKGILELFYSLNYPLESKILYFEEINEYRKDINNNQKNELLFDKEYKINLKKVECNMPISDYRFEKTFDNIFNKKLNIDSELKVEWIFNEVSDLVSDFKKLNYPKITIGGYADFIQGDPRTCDEKYYNKDECLFKLDSSYDLDKICMGDAGVLWALISEEDLKNKNFNEVIIDRDSC